ncbi:MAG TPA: hypothetical protein VNB86_12780, partial [Gaiellaceae bacterium]|nr:hypothetical protein [Gaiellaceae bacterium]
KPIHAHQTGTNSAANSSTPCAVGSETSVCPSCATAATKTRSKKSSSQVARRSTSSSSRVRSRGGSRKRLVSGP